MNRTKYAHVSAVLFLTLFGPLSLQAASSAATAVPPVKTLPAAAPAGTQSAPSAAQVTSVLERFRTYTGPRTPDALTALFDAPVEASIRQQPEVALSDGATIIRITIAAGSPDSTAPNVAFSGAQLVSLTRNNAGEWDLEALPDAGALHSSLTLLTGSVTREIPLTVAPAVPAGTDLSEKGFTSFLSVGTALSRPRQDLNDDGRQDYQDDYIFTANYLAGQVPAASAIDSPAVAGSQRSTSGQPAEPQVPDAGAASTPPASADSQSSTAPETTTGKSAYQRKLSIRKQRASRQKGSTVPASGTPDTAVLPAKQEKKGVSP